MPRRLHPIAIRGVVVVAAAEYIRRSANRRLQPLHNRIRGMRQLIASRRRLQVELVMFSDICILHDFSIE